METITATPETAHAVPVKAPGPMVVRDNRAGAVERSEDAKKTRSLIDALADAARDPSTDIVKMERIYAMVKDMRALDAEAAFNAAMARAQRNVLPVARDRFNDQTKSWYATQAAICEAIVPIYSVEGLSVSFDTADCPREGNFRTVAIVSHELGHTRRYTYDLPLDDAGIAGTKNKTKVHATKSTTTYARNTLLCMIFNIATRDKEADDDGNGPGGPAAPAMTMEHQLILDDICRDIGPKIKNTVMRAYKVKSFGDIADTEYATIAKRLELNRAKTNDPKAGAK